MEIRVLLVLVLILIAGCAEPDTQQTVEQPSETVNESTPTSTYDCVYDTEENMTYCSTGTDPGADY